MADPAQPTSPNAQYEEASAAFGTALERLARAYEADAEKRRDLLQDIHFALWKSLPRYTGRCSLRTWVYRVAHNVAASHVMRQHRIYSTLVSLEEMETLADPGGGQDQRELLERLTALIQGLKPLDRQVILAYLEGMDAEAIGEIAGISAANVATKIHRIKTVLARRFPKGGHRE